MTTEDLRELDNTQAALWNLINAIRTLTDDVNSGRFSYIECWPEIDRIRAGLDETLRAACIALHECKEDEQCENNLN